MVFLPFGYFFCEKAINAASITIRASRRCVCQLVSASVFVNWCQATVEVISPDGRDDFNMFVGQLPQSPVTVALQKMLGNLQFGGTNTAASKPSEPNSKSNEMLVKPKAEVPDDKAGGVP